ncbi:D-glycero-beta-D-manno-heptose 1-phosphate adenylyltransferase [Streptomyces sp. NPDC085529]|uniref:D-glycero-beta-D-manno-heptose 1-phosphate adenylyltransferase n=1 Tax=Streptomyces sp. NPDC085529 TaxID=3365729 RepID=UPI0037D1A8F8
MNRGPIVVVGDLLLDEDIEGTADRLAPDAPAPVVDVTCVRRRAGGAGLAARLAAELAARPGDEVVLVAALGTDADGEAARRALGDRVRVVPLPLHGTLPVKTRVLAGGRPLVRLDRGGGRPGAPSAAVEAVLRSARAVLVSDYGRGTPDVLRPVLAAVARRVPVVWDPHPRGGPPVPGTRLATPNAGEAAAFTAPPHPASVRSPGPGSPPVPGPGSPAVSGQGPPPATPLRAHADRGTALAERWGAAQVVVTLGAEGALLTRAGSGAPLLVPAPRVTGGDPCGAGDCFAAAVTVALGEGALPEEAVERAVAEAAAFVAAGGASAVGEPADDAASPRPPAAPGGPAPGDVLSRDASSGGAFSGDAASGDAFALARMTRARGGTVVATGGCFDLLHAGHVGLLERAGRIGDCLIVCVNSDASVARLKGPGRPLTPLADRMRVLDALGSVDAVVAFDEDTPERLLDRLRPDVWVKGGDYTADGLPETEALRRWGGQTVVLPYLDGRSTSSLAHRAARAAAAGSPDR